MRHTNKIWQLTIVLIILSLMLAACGGDDDNGDNGDNGNDVSLSEQFEASVSGVDVQVSHPEGWVARAESDQIVLATDNEVLDLIGTAQTLEDFTAPDEAVGVLILVLPAEALGPDGQPADFINGIAAEGGPLGTEIGTPEDLTIGDRDAAKAPLSGDINGEVYVVRHDSTYLVFVALSKTYSDHAATIAALVGSASVSTGG